MTNSRRPHFSIGRACLAGLALFAGSALAQRPSNASVCDYYAQALYGTNTSDTQQKLIAHIVSLAFEGGTGLPNVSTELTGILRPGKFGGSDISLLQYFNGSRRSTNVNNAAIGINWLDSGGPDPLSAFLTGQTETLVLATASNQEHLFGNFFVAFSRAFGCTRPFPPLASTSGPVGLAYAHKFMNLEYNQLGYFIKQLTQAAIYYGFSIQDAETFNTRLNSLYNVRCAPAVTFSPAAGPMLLSLCQNPTCPLAVPVSDCAAYVNLTANAIPSSNPTTIYNTATATATVTGSSAPTTAPPPSDTPAAAAADKLSTGGIAGVAIGGAAVLLAAVVALVFFLKKRRRTPPPTPAGPAPTWGDQQYSSPTLGPASPFTAKDSHLSHYSVGPAPSEMDTSRHVSMMDQNTRVSSPVTPGHPSYQQQWTGPAEMWVAPPVEIDSASPGTHQWQQGQGEGEMQSPATHHWQQGQGEGTQTPTHQWQQGYGHDEIQPQGDRANR